MPIALRHHQQLEEMGRRAARAFADGGQHPCCPYAEDSADGGQWLAGWYAVVDTPPLVRSILARPADNQGRNAPLKAGSAPGLNMMRGRIRILSDATTLNRAANDPLPRAGKDQVHRKRGPEIKWDEVNKSWLRQLHGDGFTIDDIAGIMKAGPREVQKRGYMMGLSWRGRGPKA